MPVGFASYLTKLDLSGCGISHLPEALTNLSGLRVLNVSRTPPLQLSDACVGVVRQLRHLRKLVLMDQPSELPGWASAAHRPMQGLRAELPDLIVQLDLSSVYPIDDKQNAYECITCLTFT